MIRYFCDLCGYKSRLSKLIRFNDVNDGVSVGVSFELCNRCYKSIFTYFKDIHMNIKEEEKNDKCIS